MGDLPGYGSVWLDYNGRVNILALNNVKRKYHVKYDSEENDVFDLYNKKDGLFVSSFCPSASGLYVINMAENDGLVLVTTVAKNRSRYTDQDYQRAAGVRRLQKQLGPKSTKDMLHMIDRKELRNNPYTRANVLAAEDLFGSNLGSL